MRSIGVGSRRHLILSRIFILILGLAAVIWGGVVLPVFRRDVPVNQVATELLKGQTFKLNTLVAEAQRASPVTSVVCNPTELHSAVALRRAVLNDVVASDLLSAANIAAAALDNSARSAAACSPSDSFVWLTMFWLDTARHGLTPQNERYLRLSYKLGPNEGWVAYWRVQLTLAELAHLPEDLSSDVLGDFVKLINTRILYEETAGIFERAPVDAQNRIIEALKYADARPREAFAKALSDRGFDVRVPGTKLPELRPWQR